jgi:hypothetical protein
MPHTQKKRCPNGSQRNTKTGICEPRNAVNRKRSQSSSSNRKRSQSSSSNSKRSQSSSNYRNRSESYWKTIGKSKLDNNTIDFIINEVFGELGRDYSDSDAKKIIKAIQKIPYNRRYRDKNGKNLTDPFYQVFDRIYQFVETKRPMSNNSVKT